MPQWLVAEGQWTRYHLAQCLLSFSLATAFEKLFVHVFPFPLTDLGNAAAELGWISRDSSRKACSSWSLSS